MAGSFGFEREKYDVSIQIGEVRFCLQFAKLACAHSSSATVSAAKNKSNSTLSDMACIWPKSCLWRSGREKLVQMESILKRK